jgi:hypothetical protein
VKPYRVAVTSNSHKAINNALEALEKRVVMMSQSFGGSKKGSRDKPDTHFDSTNIRTVNESKDIGAEYPTRRRHRREDQRQQFDYLIVDEAGQVSLGNLVAMAGAARNIVVSDQMQLPQPVQGVHPGESDRSCCWPPTRPVT